MGSEESVKTGRGEVVEEGREERVVRGRDEMEEVCEADRASSVVPALQEPPLTLLPTAFEEGVVSLPEQTG